MGYFQSEDNAINIDNIDIDLDDLLLSQASGNTLLQSIDTILQEIEVQQEDGNNSLSSIDTKINSLATTTLQTTGNTSLSSIDSKLTNNATTTLQTTGNNTLSSINTKLTNNATTTLQASGISFLNEILIKLDSLSSDTLQASGLDVLNEIKLQLEDVINYQSSGIDLIESIDTKLNQLSTSDLQVTNIDILNSIELKLDELATSGNQVITNSYLDLINTNLENPLEVEVNNFPLVQAVSGTIEISNFPVDNSLTDNQLRATPVDVNVVNTINISATGLALESKQDIGNSTLQSIDNFIENVSSGIGIPTNTIATSDIGDFSLISLFKRLLDKLTNIISVRITDGAGIANTKQLGVQITNADVGLITNTIIHGLTTGGGGGYIDVKVTPSGALTVESTVSSSALPTGASTSALQTTSNTKLDSIITNTTGLALSSKQDITNTTLGSQSDISATSDTGTFSLISFIKRGLENWTTLLSKIPSLVSGRIPVDNSGVTQPISVSSLPLPSGASTETTLTQVRDYLDTVETKLQSLITNLGLPFQTGDSIGNTSFIVNAGTNLNTSALNVETTQQLVLTALNDIKTYTDGLENLLSTLNSKDFATQTTLDLIKSKTDNLDVALSTRAITGLTDIELRATPVEVEVVNSLTISTSGLATSDLQETGNTLLTSINNLLSNPLDVELVNGQINISASGLATEEKQDITNDILISGNQISQVTGDVYDDYYPVESGIILNQQNLSLDASGSLKTRSSVLTDEISFRDDFINDTLLTDWIQNINSGSIGVANSKLTLGSGTLDTDFNSIIYEGDYCPITLRGVLSISQRISNQVIIFGLVTRDISNTIISSAYFEFTGTNSQKVNVISQGASGSSNIQTTSNIQLPATFVTSQDLYYKVDVSNNTVSFSISNNGLNYFPLAQHTLHIPNPYDLLNIELSTKNNATVTNTNLICDLVFINNMNRVQVDNDFQFEPMPNVILGNIGNTYKQINSSPTGELKVELSGNNISAFGDINTAEFVPLVQLDFVYGINVQTGKSTIVNTGVVDTNAGRLRLQTGTNSTGSAIFESVRPAKYRPGQGVDAKFTILFTTGVANSQQEIGVGNLVDGYFFGYVGTVFGIIYRNNSVQTFIPQSDWNVDPCDGTGITGININPLFGNLARIKYPYLGYGNIKFLIQNPNDGNLILVHVIKYVNTTATTQLTNPNLSFWARVFNNGNTTNLISYCGSAGIFLSGERKFLGATWAINNAKLNISTTLTNILTLKNATTYNGVTNRSLIRLKSISFAGDGGTGYSTLIVIKNATLGGTPSYTPISGSTSNNGVTITNGNSITSYDFAGTTITGGQALFNTTVARNSSSFLDITELDIFLESGSTLTFACIGRVSTDMSVAVNWVEDI